MQIDINDYPTEEVLQALIDEKKLLDEKVVGYGQMLDELYKKHVRPHLKGPMFVTEYPLEIKALAKASKNDPTKSASFQLVVNGVEMINAYNEPVSYTHLDVYKRQVLEAADGIEFVEKLLVDPYETSVPIDYVWLLSLIHIFMRLSLS